MHGVCPPQDFFWGMTLMVAAFLALLSMICQRKCCEGTRASGQSTAFWIFGGRGAWPQRRRELVGDIGTNQGDLVSLLEVDKYAVLMSTSQPSSSTHSLRPTVLHTCPFTQKSHTSSRSVAHLSGSHCLLDLLPGAKTMNQVESADQPALGPDGRLLDASKIIWFNDPDDSHPIQPVPSVHGGDLFNFISVWQRLIVL